MFWVSCSVVVENLHVKPTKKKVQRNQNIFIVVSFLVLSVSIARILQHVQSNLFLSIFAFPRSAWIWFRLCVIHYFSFFVVVFLQAKVCSYSIKNTRKKTFSKKKRGRKRKTFLKNLSHISSRTRLIKNIFWRYACTKNGKI
jgi:hypothetical protein